jgi:hypothetical protein
MSEPKGRSLKSYERRITLECPFCGHPAPKEPEPGPGREFVSCPDCGARGPSTEGPGTAEKIRRSAMFSERKSRLISLWNARNRYPEIMESDFECPTPENPEESQ